MSCRFAGSVPRRVYIDTTRLRDLLDPLPP